MKFKNSKLKKVPWMYALNASKDLCIIAAQQLKKEKVTKNEKSVSTATGAQTGNV
jgi:hypothetical protein